MALIKCPECGNQISSIANNCPNCGCPSSVWNFTQKPIFSNGEKTFLDIWLNTPFEFGRYPFDENGIVKPITWLPRALIKERKLAILISQYIIDAKPVHDSFYSAQWDNCSLNRWLNTTFLNTAFTEAERGVMSAVNLESMSGCNNKVYIPTPQDVRVLFLDDYDRRCQYTPYAASNGLFIGTGIEKEYGPWWTNNIIKNKETEESYSTVVKATGELNEKTGYAVDYGDTGVRPMIVVNYNGIEGHAECGYVLLNG